MDGMDGWMEGLMEGLMDGWLEGWINCSNSPQNNVKYGYIERLIDMVHCRYVSNITTYLLIFSFYVKYPPASICP